MPFADSAEDVTIYRDIALRKWYNLIIISKDEAGTLRSSCIYFDYRRVLEELILWK